MPIKDNIAELRRLRDELMEIDFGYPLGNNEVSPPREVELSPVVLSRIACEATKELLSSLYAQCDGFSFPDVHVGYFLKPTAKLESYDRSSEPDTLLLDGAHAVLPLGSTGGGSLFVADGQAGRVLLLPPGPLHDGVYDANGLDVREVSANIEQFIEKLTADVRAFVRDSEHNYVA